MGAARLLCYRLFFFLPYSSLRDIDRSERCRFLTRFLFFLFQVAVRRPAHSPAPRATTCPTRRPPRAPRPSATCPLGRTACPRARRRGPWSGWAAGTSSPPCPTTPRATTLPTTRPTPGTCLSTRGTKRTPIPGCSRKCALCFVISERI